MSRIINPNAPKPNRSDLTYILEMMRVIAAFRQQYLDLRALVEAEESSSQREIIYDAMEEVVKNLLAFIFDGAKEYGSKNSEPEQTSTQSVKENSVLITPTEK